MEIILFATLHASCGLCRSRYTDSTPVVRTVFVSSMSCLPLPHVARSNICLSWLQTALSKYSTWFYWRFNTLGRTVMVQSSRYGIITTISCPIEVDVTSQVHPMSSEPSPPLSIWSLGSHHSQSTASVQSRRERRRHRTSSSTHPGRCQANASNSHAAPQSGRHALRTPWAATAVSHVKKPSVVSSEAAAISSDVSQQRVASACGSSSSTPTSFPSLHCSAPCLTCFWCLRRIRLLFKTPNRHVHTPSPEHRKGLCCDQRALPSFHSGRASCPSTLACSYAATVLCPLHKLSFRSRLSGHHGSMPWIVRPAHTPPDTSSVSACRHSILRPSPLDPQPKLAHHPLANWYIVPEAATQVAIPLTQD